MNDEQQKKINEAKLSLLGSIGASSTRVNEYLYGKSFIRGIKVRSNKGNKR